MADLKCVSLNVRGLRGEKRNTIFRWLTDNQFDICLLQETYCSKEFADRFKKGWEGEIIHSLSNSSHSRGVCILLKKGLLCKTTSVHCDDSGRLLLVNLEIGGNEYSICNIYCPNVVNERILFLQRMENFIETNAISKRNLLIGGDFNCVDSMTDKSTGSLDKSSKFLNDLKNKMCLIDMWRFKNPETIEYTYIDPSSNCRNSRIDLWLSTKALMSNIQNCNITQAPAPDHKAVCFYMVMDKKIRGKGYWKMNNQVITEKDYVEGITTLYNEVVLDYGHHVTKGNLWEYLKLRIKQYTITYCIAKAKNKKDQIKDLETKLNDLDESLALKRDVLIEDKRKAIKTELDCLYKAKSKGYQIRSRAKWVEEGEKNTSFFLGLEKKRQSSNCINSLRGTDGNINNSDVNILSTARGFYSQLYTSQASADADVDSFLESVKPENILSDTDRDLCEGIFKIEECTCAVNNMKKNKSPGLDGISIEFYQHFWLLIGHLLVDVFNESHENEKLPDSQRKSVMSLIFKKGDEDDIANYRPISLTNMDYRIMAFVLANRLQNVIGSIVNHDQTAYIKGRYMGTNIRLVSDVIDYYDMIEKSGLLLMLDFKKAFDSLEWNFLFKTLKLFNFGPSFIRWINTIYTLPEACIKNNGYLSESFSIHRGIRQGCPVSALIFVLCVEILGIEIRQHTGLKGFNLGNPVKQIKVIQYADDGIIFINDKHEMCCALSILNKFGKFAGTVLNTAKCEGFWLGKDKGLQNNCKLFGIKWPKQIRCLGVYLGHNKDLNTKSNWDEKINLVEDMLDKWAKRNLTLFGKVQIIKTFAISKLVLPATLLPIPQNIIKRINKILYRFIWGSNDKIKRTKVIKDIKSGGLGMIDTQCLFESFKARWVNRLMLSNPDIHGWAQLPRIFLSKFTDNGLNVNFNFDESVQFKELDNIHPFYKEIVIYYNKVYVTDSKHFEQNILSQPIWGNKFITTKNKHKKKVLFLRNWIRSGVNKLEDLRFINGVLDETHIHQKINNKQNIYVEIILLKQALRPFEKVLKNAKGSNVLERLFDKSNIMYKRLIISKTSNVLIQSNFLQPYCYGLNNIVCIENAFYNKIFLEKEIKLREFNFKVLHGILPCNKNLKQWKIIDCDKCDICDEIQTIEHLLFQCTYLKPLWKIIENVFKIKITFKIICCLSNGSKLKCNTIITLITFLIYKEWLLLSLEKTHRTSPININFFKNELTRHATIYKLCSTVKESHITDIYTILDEM